MKTASYDHLPFRDWVAFIRLLVFVEGLEAKHKFAATADKIVAETSK
jgi:hypothetical protein